MIYCKELDKNFETEKEMFKSLIDNAQHIIAQKKSCVYKSVDRGLAIETKPLDHLKLSTATKALSIDSDYYYIAVSTTKILDSHRDLHIDKCFNRTVKGQQGKVYLVDSHNLSVLSTLVKKEDIEMFTAVIPFAMVGQKYEGDTEALIYKFRKDKVINDFAKQWLESGDSIQSSIRMQYVDIVFCMNSKEKEDVKYKDNYDKYYPMIANKKDFEEEIQYFWAVTELKNVAESSLVLFGSNHATGELEEKNNIPPSKDTESKGEPSNDTHKDFYINLLNN